MSASHAYDTKAWAQYYPDWVNQDIDYGEDTLIDTFNMGAEKYPERPALDFFGKKTTYAELEAAIRETAAGLQSLGVGYGDRVALALPNCPQHIISLYAILSLGAAVIEHNPLYTAHELTVPFQDHQAKVAIIWDKIASVFQEVKANTALETIISVNMTEEMPVSKRLALKLPIEKVRAVRAQLTEPAPDTIPFKKLRSRFMGGSGESFIAHPDITKDTPALILYTSGTTGVPKGAELNHGNLVANIKQGQTWVPGLGTSADHERLLGALPLFHAYGFTMVATLGPMIGGEMYLLPKPDMNLIMQLMKRDRPTWIPGVPPLYSNIMDAAAKKNISLKGIRNSFSGAATLPAATEEAWEAATHGRLVEGYGLTETSPIIVGNPMNDNRRPGYIGIPFPNTEIRIVDTETGEILPDGTPGELQVKGPQVFNGYINRSETNAEVFKDGWFETGDMAVMESDGFIRLVSRIKEMIITGGFNVYPVEVEEVLREHSDVEEVAVVGVPQPNGSEKVAAVITLRDGALMDPEALRNYAKKRLTPYKVPRQFYHFESLAKDQMGKIRRREVQADLIKKLEESQ